MRVFTSDSFALPLPPGHRFPIHKYAMLRQALQEQVAGLVFCPAPCASDAQLATVHTATYIDWVQNGTGPAALYREIGFPWSPALALRARHSVGATVAALQAALEDGVSGNLAGGTHHAFADRGSGFCVFNDAAVAIRVLQQEADARAQPRPRVAVVDLDVHQGNGTAAIFAADPSVFTLSLHGERNFPARKETSSLDVPLPDGCTDAHYLQALEDALHALERRFSPDGVLYLAGADPLQEDRLGRLALTPQGLWARDRLVFSWCRQRGLPVAFMMGGGYADPIERTVAAQVGTVRQALQACRS